MDANAAWLVIDKLLGNNSSCELIQHQTESYNKFVFNNLEEVISGFNPIELQHRFNETFKKHDTVIRIIVKNPVLARPVIYEKDGSVKPMTPYEARARNFTYSGHLYGDVSVETNALKEDGTYTTSSKNFRKVPIGKIPVMVGSDYCITKTQLSKMLESKQECKYDTFGYFVINGTEKVVISQDRVQENKTFVFPNKTNMYSYVAEIRSVQDNVFSPPKLTVLKLSTHVNEYGPYIRASIHHVRTEIPLCILFRALGVESDRDIMKHVTYTLEGDEAKKVLGALAGTIFDGNTVFTQKEALEYLAKHINLSSVPKELLAEPENKVKYVKDVLETEFLPHVGRTFAKKALYIGHMTRKLVLQSLNMSRMDDRDSYVNKRCDTPGILMANIFRQYFGKLVKEIKKMVNKELHTTGAFTGNISNAINKHNITRVFKSTIIDSGMKYALSTGIWGLKSNKNTRHGVAQVLNRMTYCATLSHLRRVNTPIEKSGKLVQPRRLHTTQWGIMCPAECFDPKTPILTWEGTIKEALDIVVGDYLINDNGNAVRVKSTCSGVKRMFEVVPDKDNFMRYTVTDNHVLTLKVKKNIVVRNHRGRKELSWFDKEKLGYMYKDFANEDELNAFRSSLNDDDVIDITIDKYMLLPKNVQKNLYVFKSAGINWEKKEVALDPYILGMWLGDGMSSGYGFATADKELLATYGLVNNKHIPLDYLVNDHATRLAVLAGLVDTGGSVRAKGHEIEIRKGEKNYRILHDTEFLARSLGFSCHVRDGVSTYAVNGEKRQKPHKELYITGVKLHEIPTKLNKFDPKRCNGFLQSSFKLVEKDVQPFVGWQVEGNGRFLLGDMSVSHNTPEVRCLVPGGAGLGWFTYDIGSHTDIQN